MGWWFSGHAASIKGCCKKVKMNLCDVTGVAVDVLSRSQSRLTFWTFVDHFMVAFGLNRLQETLKGKVVDKVRKKKEKDLLNCKYKVTFQPDGCTVPTCVATCFVHFGFGHRLDNTWLMKCTFAVFYLFVYWFCLWVRNVWVNQKRFLYITGHMICHRRFYWGGFAQQNQY